MLSYLFKAIYKDGTEYNQDQNDISQKDPTRSSFYDIDHDKLARFELRGNGKIISVDLTSGEFELNGFPISSLILSKDDQDYSFENLSGEKLRLIYFRRRSAIVGQQAETIGYLIGWQATINGQNIKRIIEIK